MPYTDYAELLRALRDEGYVGEIKGSSRSPDVLEVRSAHEESLSPLDYDQVTSVLEFYSPSWSDESEQFLLKSARSFAFLIY